MPHITVKAFAEMLRMPAYEQSRILHEQKYPKAAPQTFKAPYYAVALSGIRSHYASPGTGSITAAISKAKSLKPSSKAVHNVRVLSTFQSSPQASRLFSLQSSVKGMASVNGVDFKLRFDLSGREQKNDYCLFYNFRDAELDPEVARVTLELANWILAQTAQSKVPRLQYVDLRSGKVFDGKPPRGSTIKRLTENARIIAAIWPTL